MDTWSRSTPWRQGKFLTNETAAELGLTDGDPDTSVVVVTHDCDLTQPPEFEPEIEVVVGKLLSKDVVDGNCTNAKNSRKLHLLINGAKKLFLEIEATKKSRISKFFLIAHTPSIDIHLDKKGKTILQRWLASRYRRSAFPDEFETRLKSNKLDKKLADAAKKQGSNIAVIYFDIKNEDIKSDENYLLDIVILYDTAMDANAAAHSAEILKTKIRDLFESRLYNKSVESWKDIELGYVDVVSDESLSYKDSQLLKAWRLEYISLGADPQQPVAEE